MLFAFFTANQSDPTTTESKSVNAHVSHDDFGANGTNIFEQSMDLTGGIEIDTEDAAQGVEPGSLQDYIGFHYDNNTIGFESSIAKNVDANPNNTVAQQDALELPTSYSFAIDEIKTS